MQGGCDPTHASHENLHYTKGTTTRLRGSLLDLQAVLTEDFTCKQEGENIYKHMLCKGYPDLPARGLVRAYSRACML